ncbi:MAG: restriction endonuclease subunit S [Thaumarchaeota archaeon]|nr:restriction endonuclease subunit S [Nitrososphaerota archaeon]
MQDILEYEQPTRYLVKSKKYNKDYKVPVLTAGKTFLLGYTNENTGIFPDTKLPVIIFDDFTTATKLVNFPFKVKSSAIKILKAKSGEADITFIFHMMQNIQFDASTHKRYWISQYSKLEIPLPPIEVQKKIIAEIESYQKIIDGAQQVVDNWKPVINIDPDWSLVELKSVISINPKSSHNVKDAYDKGKYPFFTSGEKIKKLDTYLIDGQNIIMADGGKAKFNFYNGKASYSNHCYSFRSNNPRLQNRFLYYMLQNQEEYITQNMFHGSGLKNLNRKNFLQLKISVPPIKIQEQIIGSINQEQKIVDSCKSLIDIMKSKIQQTISKIY